MRVLSLPGRHPYVAHLAAVGGDAVLRVDGEPEAGEPDGGDVRAGEWSDLGDVDLVHVHVGLTTCSALALSALTDQVRPLGLPLVVTVHDLPHPGHPDPDRVARVLDVLMPVADDVVTLTVAAARLVLAGWGRTSHVLPHPHVLDASALGAPLRPVGPPVVGLAAASAGEEVGAMVDVALAVVGEVPGARLRLDLPWTGAVEPAGLARRWAGLALVGGLDLRRHEHQVSDPAVYLRQVDVCVLHRQDSSLATWLEACFDAGVPVVAPEHGLYCDRPWAQTYDPARPLTLASALRTALRSTSSRQAHREERLAERELIALAHAELYGALLDRQRRGG